jgi:FAD dependent oxidoreductase
VPQNFDFIIIGGGLFGCYSAHFLANKGAKVALLEKEAQLFQKASIVNQARLHGGYHYPRSIATAAMSDEHKQRFTKEHRDFVNFSFEKYYAIEKYGSFTDARQFERFCAFVDIKCDKIEKHPLFNFDRMEALYLTEEFSFDPILLGKYYTEKVENHPNIQIFKSVLDIKASETGKDWQIEFQVENDKTYLVETPTVINATYAASNAINQIFGAKTLDLTHEISEIAFVKSKLFHEKGLTVMDGAFGSIMPYGKSGVLSLTSVAYTHHKISYENLPVFDCQIKEDTRCKPTAPGICTTCDRRPQTNANKMLGQMKQYFSENVDFEYLYSFFTIKSKLKANYIDDGRPTEIAKLRDNPRFYCLFAGKVNSIYEIEKII